MTITKVCLYIKLKTIFTRFTSFVLFCFVFVFFLLFNFSKSLRLGCLIRPLNIWSKTNLLCHFEQVNREIPSTLQIFPFIHTFTHLSRPKSQALWLQIRSRRIAHCRSSQCSEGLTSMDDYGNSEEDQLVLWMCGEVHKSLIQEVTSEQCPKECVDVPLLCLTLTCQFLTFFISAFKNGETRALKMASVPIIGSQENLGFTHAQAGEKDCKAQKQILCYKNWNQMKQHGK